MNAYSNSNEPTTEIALRAKLRMSYFLLLLLLIHFIEAFITFPFVDHTTNTQNVVYGLIVTAPFIIINIIFIALIRKDLSQIGKA